MRTFLALELPEDALAALAAYGEALQEAVTPAPHGVRLRWTKPHQRHVTLRFFGDTDETTREKIIAVTTRTLVGHAPLTLTLGRLGAFPAWRFPRVVWAGVLPAHLEIQALFQALDDAFDDAGLGRSDKPNFVPHVTMAYVKGNAGKRLAKAFAPLWKQELGVYTLRDVVLFESVLGENGHDYKALHRWTLEQA